MDDLDMSKFGRSMDVFFAHNSQDKPFVRKIARALRDEGLEVWLDVDDLPPSEQPPRPCQAARLLRKPWSCPLGGANGFHGLSRWESPRVRGPI